ncbi:hypothetical protein JCM10207_008976 [Rhodosporidiobolus poonsookiae]
MLSARHYPTALVRPCKRRCLSSFAHPDPLQPTTPPDDAPKPPYNILFFGADSFSCDVFKRVHEARTDLVDQITVVTPPDQRTGRKLREVHRPPLRLLAEELNVPSIALPKTLLKGWQPPDLFLPSPSTPLSTPPSARNLLLTASFGHLIPSALLSLFRPLNALNVHPSLLPKWRGAAPIQHGIMSGEADEAGGMGVTVQELSRGRFDQGRILGQQVVDVPPDADFLTLEPILARAGGNLLASLLLDLSSAQASATLQDASQATLAPKLHKHSAHVDWATMTGDQVLRLQRGVGHQYPLWTSLPTASTTLQLLLSPLLTPLPTPLVSRPSGSVTFDAHRKELVVRCADAHVGVVVERVKKEGGRWVEAREWWNGVGRKGAEVVLQ